jgi:2-iminoacetate synthase ThiH
MRAWFAADVEYRDPLFGNGLGDIKKQVLKACMTEVESLTEAQTRKSPRHMRLLCLTSGKRENLGLDEYKTSLYEITNCHSPWQLFIKSSPGTM